MKREMSDEDVVRALMERGARTACMHSREALDPALAELSQEEWESLDDKLREIYITASGLPFPTYSGSGQKVRRWLLTIPTVDLARAVATIFMEAKA